MKTKKKTVAKADANARAKELKRARDARYRAKKQAAKACARTQADMRPQDANSRTLQNVVVSMGLAIISCEMVLGLVANCKDIPAGLRKAASSAMDIAHEAVGKLRTIEEKGVK